MCIKLCKRKKNDSTTETESVTFWEIHNQYGHPIQADLQKHQNRAEYRKDMRRKTHNDPIIAQQSLKHGQFSDILRR